MYLKHKDYTNISMFIFLLVGLSHLWRAFNKMPLMVGDMSIPVGASWIAGVAALYLAYSAYKFKN